MGNGNEVTRAGGRPETEMEKQIPSGHGGGTERKHKGRKLHGGNQGSVEKMELHY